MTTIKPAQGYYLINPLPSPKSSGIIVHTPDQEPPYMRGEVLDIGSAIVEDGKWLNAEYKIGDIVWYSYSGFEDITIASDTLRLIRFRAIVGREYVKK